MRSEYARLSRHDRSTPAGDPCQRLAHRCEKLASRKDITHLRWLPPVRVSLRILLPRRAQRSFFFLTERPRRGPLGGARHLNEETGHFRQGSGRRQDIQKPFQLYDCLFAVSTNFSYPKQHNRKVGNLKRKDSQILYFQLPTLRSCRFVYEKLYETTKRQS